MPIISAPQDFHVEDLYIDLRSVFDSQIYLKCEGFNFAGSIKLKSAVAMVEAAERDAIIGERAALVESSSGNLGIALSLVAASKGYKFICVTDPRCTMTARRIMETLGSTVHVVDDDQGAGGYLGARIRYVKKLVTENGFVWLNQYSNLANVYAHYATTGPEIAKMFPDVDVLFIGAGTTGTLMGCARYFREFRPATRIVAVDSVGSVTFGGTAAPRMIPGLGTSIRPQILDESYCDDIVHVPEADAVAACRRLAERGFLLGGSTGTVVSGALSWLARHRQPGDDLTAIAVAPDLGERYVDSIYNDEWVNRSYGLLPRA